MSVSTTPGLLTLPGQAKRTIRTSGIGSGCALTPSGFHLGAASPTALQHTFSSVQAALEEARQMDGGLWSYNVHSCR